MANITNISIEKLHPHRDNPRKNIGDVTELAESIKVNGILQNLTVVPNNSEQTDFTVIIGHRRLAAAKQAGLTELPCAIVEMSEKEQMSTMLTENMQRTDLTVYEQAQGFQMLIDLGDSVAGVVEKTGFSESTVRRRLKLAELDEKAFRESQIRQVRLEDYEKLNVIKNIDKRNELLEKIGTNNFANAFKNAKQEQEDAENKIVFEEKLKNFATKISSCDDVCEEYKYEGYLGFNKVDDYIKNHSDNKERVYYFSKYGLYANLYVKPSDEEKEKKNSEEKQRAIKMHKYAELKEKVELLDRRMENLIIDFISSSETINKVCNSNDCKDIVLKYIFENVINARGRMYFDETVIDNSILLFYENNKCINFDEAISGNKFAKLLLVTSFAILTYNNEISYCELHYGESKVTRSINSELNKYYQMIKKLGYVISDEEIQLRDGTHSIFF